MTVSAVKLVDLIERGRGNSRTSTLGSRARQTADEERLLRTSQTSQSEESVATNIEMLAVKLYSLSRTRAENPGDLMREALRSIESCLVSIKQQH